MRWLVAMLLYCGISVAHAQADECVDVNIVLAVDSSSSISPFEWQMQMQGYQAAFFDPDIINLITEGPCGAIAAAVLRWSAPDYQVREIDWTRISDTHTATVFGRKIGTLPYRKRSSTAIFIAMNRSLALLDAAPYRAEKLVIDISGDGENSPQTLLETNEAPCTTARERGVTINGLPIISNLDDLNSTPKPTDEWAQRQYKKSEMPLDEYYQKYVICGYGAFIEPAYGFDDFPRAFKRKLQRELIASLE